MNSVKWNQETLREIRNRTYNKRKMMVVFVCAVIHNQLENPEKVISVLHKELGISKVDLRKKVSSMENYIGFASAAPQKY